MPDIIHYPDPSAKALKGLLSKRLGVGGDNLILGNGAVELIYLLAHALKPGGALLPGPTFSEYERALKAVDCEVRRHLLRPEQNFRLDPSELAVRGFDLLVICNPNNPTGNLLPEKDFVNILEMARDMHAFIVVDESFMDFVEPDLQWRAARFLQEYDRLFVLYSLTKFFAIPGLRLGCGIGSPDLIRRMDSLKDPWNVNSLALAAGTAALQDELYELRSRQFIRLERQYLQTELAQLPGLEPLPGNANFLLVHNKGKVTGQVLIDRLGSQGVLVRNCAEFPGLGQHYFRIAVKDRIANKALIAALRDILI